MATFGYTGEILQVDLSTGQVSRLPTSDYSDRFLGGRGIAARIYWDKVPPHIKAFDPANHLIFVTGPLAGFTGLAACRWQICGKSPAMELETFSYANFGGSWGAWLKFAGYDGLVVTGKAGKPVYIYITGNGKVEIRDASNLRGKTTVEARDMLQAELGKETRVLTIGPAGENLVSFATVLAADNASGAGGFGGVLGSKNLKAIVLKVEEKKRPLAADPALLQSLTRQVYQQYTANWEDGHQASLTGRVTACYGCIKGCSRRTYEADGQKFKSYCQASIFYMTPAKSYYADVEAAAEVYRLAERLSDIYGLDTTVLEPIILWLGECYRKGILDEKETGLPLSSIGSAEFIESLVKKIAFREGFGDVLARGVLKAAERIGRGSLKLIGAGGVTTRASETKDYDPRLILPNALLYATEPRRPIELLHAIAIPLRRWECWLSKLNGAFLSTEVFRKIAEEYWGGPAAIDFSTYEGKALAAKKIQDYGYIKESLIVCDTLWPILQVNTTDRDIKMGTLESRILSAITGRKIDEAGLLEISERIINLHRAIFLREGWGGRDGDRLLDYFHEEPLQGVYFTPECLVPGKDGEVVSIKGTVVERDKFEEMKSEFYALRGWDVATGLLTRKKLEALGLNDIVPELAKSGLVK